MTDQRYTQPKLNAPVDSAGHILDLLIRMLKVKEKSLAKFLGISRQALHKRRTEATPIRSTEVIAISDWLGIPPALFFGLGSDAVLWIATNQPHRLNTEPPEDDREDGELVESLNVNTFARYPQASGADMMGSVTPVADNTCWESTLPLSTRIERRFAPVAQWNYIECRRKKCDSGAHFSISANRCSSLAGDISKQAGRARESLRPCRQAARTADKSGAVSRSSFSRIGVAR